MIISKELLSEVFGQEVKFIRYIANNTYEVHFEKPIRLKYQIINIYELAHKCKEWAFEKGFSLESAKKSILRENKMISEWVSCGFTPNYEVMPTFYSETEPEVIFKACQWILDNKDRK